MNIKHGLRNQSDPSFSGIDTIDKRNYGLDLLRAIAVTLVLLWHLQPLQVSLSTEIVAPDVLLQIILLLITTFYIQVTPIAVPIFFIVSLYLFYGKTNQHKYFRKKIIRLTQVFIFWVIIQFSVYFILQILIDVYKENISLPGFSLIQSIIIGGPSLPEVGDSVFYFLFDLIFLTILAYGYMQLNVKVRKFLGVLVIVLFALYFQSCIFYRNYIPFWRPDNFIIYIPIAYFLRFSDNFLKFKYWYLSGFIIFVIQEFLLSILRGGFAVGVYSRVSIVLGAMTITSIILSSSKSKDKKNNVFVQFLSVYSLGIYALHKYWQLLFVILYVKVFSLPEMESIEIFQFRLNTIQFVSGIITSAVTLLSVYILGMTPLKKYVS